MTEPNQKPNESGELNPSENFAQEAGRSQPVRSLAEATFTKQHLAISQGAYDQTFKTSNEHSYGRQSPLAVRLRVTEVIDPTSDEFLGHLKLVGAPYGWDKRERYQPENRHMVDAMMALDTTRLYVFYVDEKPAGFCLMVAIDDEREPSPGSTKEAALATFKSQQRLSDRSSAVEIYKIGMHDEYTKQGYGHFFLAKMLYLAFERDHKDIVYLDTRDTNHRGVIPFYARNGINVFFTEVLPNDLTDHAVEAEEPHYAEGRQKSVNGDGGGDSPATTHDGTPPPPDPAA